MNAKPDMHILVLDDEPFMLKLLARLLTNLGFTNVATCDNGLNALEQVDDPAHAPQLILCDLNMPGMDGIELTRAVRTGNTHKFIPIVMLTTESQATRKEEGKMAGATGWIVKPFKPEQLLAVAKKLLR